jgi:hypothetical protein
MADLWFKRCPQCGSYTTKVEPLECAKCHTCGWEEVENINFYCNVINGYCSLLKSIL